jgi:16S rRNA (uracil1498-N3)-methyltransferase
MRKDDIFRLFNETNGEFIVKIKEIAKSHISLNVESYIRNAPEEKDLILALCIIKHDRMVEAVKAAIQLGVTKIIPIISERTQINKMNYQKFSRVILQSTEQSERFKPAELETETTLENFCNLPDIEQIIFACESKEGCSNILTLKPKKQKIAVLVGPEGGFSTQERGKIKSYTHVQAASLGDTILRTETAVTAALTCITLGRTQ